MSSASSPDREYLSISDSSEFEFNMSHLSPEQLAAKEQDLSKDEDEQLDAFENSLSGTAQFGLNRIQHWYVDKLKLPFIKMFGKSESRQKLHNESEAFHYSSGCDIQTPVSYTHLTLPTIYSV